MDEPQMIRDHASAELVLAGAPILRQRCAAVDGATWVEAKRLGATLLRVMPDARGVGLAANQIGLRLRVVALGDRAQAPPGVDPSLYRDQQREPFDPYGIVNPELRPRMAAGWSAWFEGCLSFPDYTGVVSRWNEVDVEGLGLDGTLLRFSATGWHARILQHEVDHLNGEMYIDKVCQRTLMHKSEYVSNWRGMRLAEVLRRLNTTAGRPR